jgi:ankyrin repeat protein
MFKAFTKGKINEVKKYIDSKGDIEARYSYEWTPIMVAAKYGHLEITKLLINAHADVRAKDLINRTPIMLVALYGDFDGKKQTSVEILKILLEAGSDINDLFKTGNVVFKTPFIHEYIENNKHLLSKENVDKWNILRLETLFGV